MVSVNILRTLLIVVAISFSFATESKINDEQIAIDLGIKISIDSKILGETRSLYINTPNDYGNTKKRYSVLYVLDGDNHFNHTVIANRYLQRLDRIPELIIVAIPNNEGTRYRDFSLKRENFTRFIEKEVMPYIDQRYRTTGQNSLFGFSAAGSFAIDLLSYKPDLFQNYIVSSPFISTRNKKSYNEFLNSVDKQPQDKALYFSLTEQTEEGQARTKSINQFVNFLTDTPPKKLDWRYEFIENQVHLTTPYVTMFNGLTHIFKSYQSPSLASYEEYIEFGGVNGINMHYKKRAEIYGTDESTPQSTLLNVAIMLINEDQAEASLEICQTLITQFPKSAQAYSTLGIAYDAMNQYEKSITAHKKSVQFSSSMDSDWQDLFQNRLNKINEKVSLLN